MIDLNKLKPVLADVLTDENSAERDKYWNQKVKDMFLKGDTEIETGNDEPADPYEKYTFENLMYGG